MKFNFIPRDRKFYVLFDQLSQHMIDIIVQFEKFLKNYQYHQTAPTDKGYVENSLHLKKLQEMDLAAEAIVQKLFKELFSTFVTPLDREDIHGLTKLLMSIIEHVAGAARRFEMYHIKEVRPEVFELADTLLKCVQELAVLINHLDNLGSLEKFTSLINKLDLLEKKGDHIYRSAIDKLFYNPEEPLEVIKWKDIYERLENSIDKCNSAAGIIMGIVLKYA